MPSRPRPRSSAPGVAVVAVAAALAAAFAGCGAGGKVGAAMKIYHQKDYARARARLVVLHGKRSKLNDKGRMRYYVYRGLSHFRVGERDQARPFVKRGLELYLAGKRGWLLPRIRAELNQVAVQLGTGPDAKVAAKTPPAKEVPVKKARAKSPPPPPAAKGPRKIKAGTVVAVFDVQDASGRVSQPVLAQLTEYLSAQLTAVASLKIVPRAQLRRRLSKAKKASYKNCYDSSCQIELGKAVAAQKSLSTKLLRVGNRCAITSVLFDLRSETTAGAATVDTRCGTDALMGGVKEIARRFAGLTPRKL